MTLTRAIELTLCGIAGSGGSPTDFLKAVVGKRVVVRLVGGVDYKGALAIPRLL